MIRIVTKRPPAVLLIGVREAGGSWLCEQPAISNWQLAQLKPADAVLAKGEELKKTRDARKSFEGRVECGEPKTKSQEPKTESQQPRTNSREPTAENQQPRANC